MLTTVGKRAIPGETDLATTRPDLAAELLEPELATELMAGTNRSVWWVCREGHRWEASPNNRASHGSGCPYCASRRRVPGENDLATTHPELCLELADPDQAASLSASSAKRVEWRCGAGHEWTAKPADRTRGQGCPYCSGRRAIVGETDLATAHPDLAAELADPSLATELQARSGRKVEWLCAEGHRWTARPAERSIGQGCPYCAGKRPIAGETDLATTRPDLAAQLVDHELATDLKATTHRVVRWRCDLGHEWTASPKNRALRGSGCPYCSSPPRAVLAGFNDLATTHPYLVAELQDQALATRIHGGSGKPVEWRCSEGHEWTATPNTRTNMGAGCPACASRGFNESRPGWVYLLATPGGRVYKYGITNDLEARLAVHQAQGLTEFVEAVRFDSGADARNAERAVRLLARSRGWRPGLTSAEMPDGWTETLLADDAGDAFRITTALVGEALLGRGQVVKDL